MILFNVRKALLHLDVVLYLLFFILLAGVSGLTLWWCCRGRSSSVLMRGGIVCFVYLMLLVVQWVPGCDGVCLGVVGSSRVFFCVGLMGPVFVVTGLR